MDSNVKDLKTAEATDGGKKILLVEDDLDILESFQEIIRSWGYKVFTAPSFSEATNKINNQRFDLIVLDVQLGNISGLRVIDVVRRNMSNMNNTTPIILHSGHLDAAMIQTYKQDVDEALVKPVTLAKLKEKIDHWANHRHVPSGEVTTQKQFVVLVGDSDKVFAQELAKKMDSNVLKVVVAEGLAGTKHKIQLQKYDCLMLGLEPEDKSLMKMIEELKDNAGALNHRTPIIIMGKESDSNSEVLEKLPVTGYLEKPFDVLKFKKNLIEVVFRYQGIIN